jgi:hypothetical protein
MKTPNFIQKKKKKKNKDKIALFEFSILQRRPHQILCLFFFAPKPEEFVEGWSGEWVEL